MGNVHGGWLGKLSVFLLEGFHGDDGVVLGLLLIPPFVLKEEEKNTD